MVPRSFMTQRIAWTDHPCPHGGNRGGDVSANSERYRRTSKNPPLEWLHFKQHPGNQPSGRDRTHQADRRSAGQQGCGTAEYERLDLPPRSPQCHAHANLCRSISHHVAAHSEEPHPGQKERDAAKRPDQSCQNSLVGNRTTKKCLDSRGLAPDRHSGHEFAHCAANGLRRALETGGRADRESIGETFIVGSRS